MGSALAALIACDAGDGTRSSLTESATRDARYRMSFEATSPADPDAAGRLRVRFEPSDGWHLAPEATASLSLEAPPGIEFERADQRSPDAVQNTEEVLEFATPFRAALTGVVAASGSIKFGICEGDNELCQIVRSDFELPLEIAFPR